MTHCLYVRRVCLGTWKSPPGKTKAAVIAAIKAGYRMLDCANDYDNEHVVGEALRELFAAGIVAREDLFIQVGGRDRPRLRRNAKSPNHIVFSQAKLWNGNHRPEHVKPDLEATLKDLGVRLLLYQ